MAILQFKNEKDKQLDLCYAMIEAQSSTLQLQMLKIEDLNGKIKHLEKLLLFRAQIIDTNKE